MTTTTLIDAYHVIYDVKDAYLDNEMLRIKAYSALQALATLMDALDIEVPTRFDNPERTTP